MESLQTLAARAWARHMVLEEKLIPEKADAAISQRREDLLANKASLIDSKASLIDSVSSWIASLGN